MKHSKSIKIISVLTAVLLLLAAMSISASALTDDPTTFTITIESGSDVYTPDPATATVNEGDTYTFSIPDDLPTTLTDEYLGEYEVSFSCWRFTGDYEVVEGTVNEDGESLDKTVVLRPLSDLKAVACFYEDNALFYMVRVDTNNEAYEPYIEQGECPKGENWTFSVPDDLTDFNCWEFEGEYDVVEGNIDENGVSYDRTVVLKPLSGISAFARFEELGSGSGAASEGKPKDQDQNNGKATDDQPKGGNNSKTSPQTGDKLYIVLIIMMAAVGTGAIAVKKIKE